MGLCPGGQPGHDWTLTSIESLRSTSAPDRAIRRADVNTGRSAGIDSLDSVNVESCHSVNDLRLTATFDGRSTPSTPTDHAAVGPKAPSAVMGWPPAGNTIVWPAGGGRSVTATPLCPPSACRAAEPTNVTLTVTTVPTTTTTAMEMNDCADDRVTTATATAPTTTAGGSSTPSRWRRRTWRSTRARSRSRPGRP